MNVKNATIQNRKQLLEENALNEELEFTLYLLAENYGKYRFFKIGQTRIDLDTRNAINEKYCNRKYKTLEFITIKCRYCDILRLESELRTIYCDKGYKHIGEDHFITTFNTLKEFEPVQKIFKDFIKTF